MPFNGAILTEGHSFDILGAIFESYVNQETYYHPLDPLLLVCRSWRDAALSHRALWGHINIEIGHKNSFKACTARAKSRLHRSGTTVPLDINIEVVPDKPEWDPHPESCRRHPKAPFCCHTNASDHACKLLRILAGPKGEHCKRWRSLTLHDLSGTNRGMYDRIDSFNALVYPMPSLKSIDLTEFTLIGRLLPKCPSLRHAAFCDVSGPSLPDLSNARTLKLVWGEWAESRDASTRLNLSNLNSAGKLKQIHIRNSIKAVVAFPYRFTGVTHLILEGSRFLEGLHDLHLPRLKILTIKLERAQVVEELLRCPGIPFSQVGVMKIEWEEASDQSAKGCHALRVALTKLLCKTNNVCMISMDDFVLAVVLKTIWIAKREMEEKTKSNKARRTVPTDTPFHGRSVILRSLEGGKDAVISGDATAEAIMRIAWKKGVHPPNVPWEELFGEGKSAEDELFGMLGSDDDDKESGENDGKKEEEDRFSGGWY